MLFRDKATFILLGLFGRITHLTRTSAFIPKLTAENAGYKRNFRGKNSPFERGIDERNFGLKKVGIKIESAFMTTVLSTATDDDTVGETEKATLLGTLVLLTVPLSWGTYVPVGECIFRDRTVLK